MRSARRLVAVAAVIGAALALTACDPADEPGSPDTGTSAAPTDSEPSEPRDPVELTVADAIPESYDCLLEFPGAQWLAGESGDVEVGAGLIGAGDTLVVLGHQSDGHPCSWTFLARRLVADGYLVALPAYRGGDPIGLQLGIVAHARADGATDVILGGASMGATYAIGAAIELDPAPAGVLALSPPDEYDPPGQAFPPVNAVDAAAQLDVPLLVMVAEHDTAFVSAAEQIATAAGTEPVVIVGGGHGLDLLGVDGVAAQVLDFIASPS